MLMDQCRYTYEFKAEIYITETETKIDFKLPDEF